MAPSFGLAAEALGPAVGFGRGLILLRKRFFPNLGKTLGGDRPARPMNPRNDVRIADIFFSRPIEQGRVMVFLVRFASLPPPAAPAIYSTAQQSGCATRHIS